jgi:methyltransferase (TIGR00027 family)
MPSEERGKSVESLWISANGSADHNGPSKMAEGIALQRFAESRLPEDVRIFSDPYAVHFIDPVKLAWAKEHPREIQALMEDFENKMPGWCNAIRGRIGYFGDIVQNAGGEGFSQLVLLRAGSDTRAYRIGTLQGHTRVFEIDRPATQERKIGIVKKIFGQLPDHVSFIPHDIGKGPLWPVLEAAGYSPAQKTLFLLEGLVMYLPCRDVEELLAGIAEHACAGSTVLFDFVPQSLADGTSDAEGGQNVRNGTIQIGEPILSGFNEGKVVPFLTGLGYSGVQVIPSRAYARMYFTGKRGDCKVSGLMSLAYATVAGKGRDRP